MKRMRLFIGIVLLLGVGSCDKLIQFTPFSTFMEEEEQDRTRKNLAYLESYQSPAPMGADSVEIAFLTDVHFDYKALRKVVDHIAKHSRARLAICGGDLTDQGLLNEYRWFHDEMGRLPMPYFTVIGNHDYRADGEFIYDKMYGPRNYQLQLQGWQLIFFDDVTWEKMGDPDFQWLEKTLTDGNPVGRVLITHLAPTCPQFSGKLGERFREILTTHPPALILSGHNHSRESITWEGIPLFIETRVSEHAYTRVQLYGSGEFSIMPQNF